jgi:hypothetical protein
MKTQLNTNRRSFGRLAPALAITAFLLAAASPAWAGKGNVNKVAPPHSTAFGKSLSEWLSIYWRWRLNGSDPAQSTVGRVKLLPIPDPEVVSGSGTPDDPLVLQGEIELTLPPGTPFVLPQFAWIGERYEGYPAVPDDLPIADDVLLAGVSPNLTIDGKTVVSDENEVDYYVPPTAFDPMVSYAEPSSYGSVAATFFQGCGFVSAPLTPGVHVIHLYEPYIIPAGAYEAIPDGFGVIYDNTWIITVAPGKP